MSTIISKIRPDLSPVIKDSKINGDRLSKSIEKISTGQKINHSADAPADLFVSEKLRAQSASIDQAIQNTEVDISVLQLADSSMSEMNNLLINMRQLAVQAANEAANDEMALFAIQQEYQQAMQSVDDIARNTKFGNKPLLDGSNGTSGYTSGKNLQFIRANENTKLPDSDIEGTEVIITQNATRSFWVADDEIDEDIAAENVQLKIFENGRTATYYTKAGDNPYSVAQSLQNEVDSGGLDVMVSVEDDKLKVIHNKFGSEHTFQVYSSYEDILSEDADIPNEAIRGKDVQGYVGNIRMDGHGQMMTGAKNSNLEGLALRYNGTEGDLEGEDCERTVGKLYFKYGALRFQTGPTVDEVQGISINGYNSNTLGVGVSNSNNFKNLNEVDLTRVNGGRDAMLLLDEALNNVNILRTDIGAVQKYGLESKINTLMSTRDNINAAESTIRDTDYAEEISKMLRYNIIQNTQVALQAQTNKNLTKIESILMN